MNRGLYIHFPFCERKCNYCDFYSLANHSRKSDYIDALVREINRYSGKIDTIYFGGGTPSLMSGEELKRVLDAIFEAFEVDKNAEITLEANPESVSDKLYTFHEAGINRLSLGVQSFNDDELVALGRGHSSKKAIEVIEKAKNIYDNVSLDLMFAIPYQTPKSFDNSIDTAVSLGVEHISAYALGIEDKTVFGVKRKRGEDLFLPSEDDEAEMYFLACEKLGNAGFEHYEISNFAKDGKRSRHNMKYWLGEEYIGIGAAAHSYFEGKRYSTPASIAEFCEGAEKLDSYENTDLDRAEEFVFLSLRLKDGLDTEKLEKSYGVKITHEFEKTVQDLALQGLCKYDERTLSLTEKGFFVSNTVIVKILDSLQTFS